MKIALTAPTDATDSFLLLTILSAWHQLLPGAEFHIFCAESWRSLFRVIEGVAAVLPLPDAGQGRSRADTIKIYLKNLQPDLQLDFSRISKNHHDIIRHRMEQLSMFTQASGVQIPIEQLESPLPNVIGLVAATQKFTDRHKLKYQRYVVISLTDPLLISHRWALEALIGFILWLHRRQEVQTILVGFSEQQSLMQALQSRCDCPLITTYSNDALELAAIIASAYAFVGDAAGLIQCAAAFKKPCLLLAATLGFNALQWGPWQTRQRLLLQVHSSDQLQRAYLDLTHENLRPNLAQLRRYWAAKTLRPCILGYPNESFIEALELSELHYAVFPDFDWQLSLVPRIHQRMRREQLWVLHVLGDCKKWQWQLLRWYVKQGLSQRLLLVLGHATADPLQSYLDGFADPRHVLRLG